MQAGKETNTREPPSSGLKLGLTLVLALLVVLVAVAAVIAVARRASHDEPGAGGAGQDGGVLLQASRAAYRGESEDGEASLPATRLENIQVDVTVQPRFLWPAFGSITSYFGPRHPSGIDIGLDSGEDDRVFATADGVVTYAGGDPCCEYGLYVEVQHAGGYSSLYGHLSRIDVVQGQRVAAGEVLGIGGATGLVTGKHLHFELRDSLSHVDPMRLLPTRQTGATASASSVDCGAESVRVQQASLSRLVLGGEAIGGYELKEVRLTPEDEGAPQLQVRREGSLTAVIEAPARLTGGGFGFDYRLDLTLARGVETRYLSCRIEASYFAPPPGIELATGPTDADLLRAQRAATGRAAASATNDDEVPDEPSLPLPMPASARRTQPPDPVATPTQPPYSPGIRTPTPVSTRPSGVIATPTRSPVSAPASNSTRPGPTPRPGSMLDR